MPSQGGPWATLQQRQALITEVQAREILQNHSVSDRHQLVAMLPLLCVLASGKEEEHPVNAATREAFGHGHGKTRALVDAAQHPEYSFRKEGKPGKGGDDFYRIAIPCTPSSGSSDWIKDLTEHYPTHAMEGYQNGDKEDLTEDDEDARLFQHQFKVRNTMAYSDRSACNATIQQEASWCPYGMAACFHLMVHR